MPELAYVNGAYVPLAEATISIEDRGFQFADGVYEVIATYGGTPYAVSEHMQRLQQSLEALQISYCPNRDCLVEKIEHGIGACGFGEVLVYIQITRGTAPRHHEFPHPESEPTLVMTFKELKRLPQQLYREGVKVISVPDIRWGRCDIKSIALLPNILAKQAAHEKGAFEALLVDEEGRVTEGSSTSAFCVRAGTLYTAPGGTHILPSVTRKILLELAGSLGLAVRESFSTLEQFKEADEVLLAGTTTEAVGVVEIDGVCIGDGRPGNITRTLRNAFLRAIEKRAEDGPR
jgi:D-alanine transaminase